VRLCLATVPGTDPATIRRVASHPVALQQCHRFFARHAGRQAVAAFDTAGSIKELMEGSAPYDAAIGSELAAVLYGATVVEHDLEDDPDNFTRFLVVGTEPLASPEAPVKTSLVFRLRHEPGSLHAALGVLASHGVDLTRLESRPIPGRPWEYRFYADVRGPSSARQAAAIDALDGVAEEIRVLGRYRERASEAP
jgi:prephenate dehydratase